MKNLYPTTAAIYARVSSEQQAEAATIDSQVAALEERVAHDALTLETELRFLDDGYSGATLVRPAMERLRDVAATGAIDRLYVHSPDRLSRNYAYQVVLLDEFQRLGVEVVFLNHPLGQTPEENLLLQVQGMVAEYERAKILERSRRGKLHAARQGKVSVFGQAPYGYRYVSREEGGGEAQYEIAWEEARVVQQMFQWVGVEGASISEVCRRLDAQRVPTRRGKPFWDRTTVWHILKNPAYRGTAVFNKMRHGPAKPRLRPYRGCAEQPRRRRSVVPVPEEERISVAVPAIVEDALFAAVAERLEENRRRSRAARRGAKYLLQGLIVCARCGYAYHSRAARAGAPGKQRRYAYYCCPGREGYRFGGAPVCGNKPVRADRLEEAVWQDVCSLLRDPQRIEREHQRRLAGDAQRASGHQPFAEQMQKLKRSMARVVDAYQEGLLEKSEFEPRIRRLRDRLAQVEGEARKQAEREAGRAELRLVIEHLQGFADRIQEGLQQADWSTQREILRALVKRIEVDEAQVRVIYRINPFPFDQAPDGGVLRDCSWRHPNSVDQKTGGRVARPERSDGRGAGRPRPSLRSGTCHPAVARRRPLRR
jgi:site-specific DNA recombinase